MLFDMKRCGARIRALREDMGISQSEFADVLQMLLCTSKTEFSGNDSIILQWKG